MKHLLSKRFALNFCILHASSWLHRKNPILEELWGFMNAGSTFLKTKPTKKNLSSKGSFSSTSWTRSTMNMTRLDERRQMLFGKIFVNLNPSQVMILPCVDLGARFTEWTNAGGSSMDPVARMHATARGEREKSFKSPLSSVSSSKYFFFSQHLLLWVWKKIKNNWHLIGNLQKPHEKTILESNAPGGFRIVRERFKDVIHTHCTVLLWEW